MLKILLVDNGSNFDLDTPYNSPLGGSETSLILLAKGLSELGHSIVILTSNKINPIQKGNIIIANNSLFDDYAIQSDIILLNRVVPQTIFRHYDKQIYYYSHDAYDQPILQWMYNKDLVNLFSKIICVSNWQKETFIKYFHIDKDKISVLPNSIDLQLYFGYVERNINRLIFPCIPYKGLDVLPDIFTKLCKRVKNDSLELHIFSSMKLYGNDIGDKEYELAFSRLRMPNVYLHDVISMKQLAIEFMKSSIFIHPSTYHETFGMNIVQSQAAGCIPIVVNNGAVHEVIVNNKTGFITKGKNIYNHKTMDEFIDLIINILNMDSDKLYSIRNRSHQFVSKFHYINIAKQFISIVSNT